MEVETVTKASDEPRQPAVTLAAFPGKYVSLTSYRRDGTAVATPVWFVRQDGRLLVETGAASGKVKRIRRNPAVQVAVCARGRLRGRPARAASPGSRKPGNRSSYSRSSGRLAIIGTAAGMPFLE